MPAIGDDQTAILLMVVTIVVLIVRWLMPAWLTRLVTTGLAAARERPREPE